MNEDEKKLFRKWTQQRMLKGESCLIYRSQFCLEAFIDQVDPECVKCWMENREK